MNIQEILRTYWGHTSFRPLQADIIQSVMEGKDTLALLPTGGGKSICFQVPSLAQAGICIVVSPLIALMKDQVENLRKRNIAALYIISGMGKREVDIALDNCIYGSIKFLYISPERLQSKLVQERIKYMNVNLFAIDEAHCISQWGYDFRPSYRQIRILRELHSSVPFLALTATATPEVKADIQYQLDFKQTNVFQQSFERKNLSYIVSKEEDKLAKLHKILVKVQGSAIVYVRNRRETLNTSQFLQQKGISSDYYHAGLETALRFEKQNQWTSNKTRVMVCTNAFGMGIDKPDVRIVIHLEPPESLEAYYQEAGRAGRDEQKAYAVLLCDNMDATLLNDRVQKAYPSVEEIKKVYHFLGNYFQIAIGTGEGLSLNFDIGDFCKKHHLDAIKTVNALKFLERSEYLCVSDAVFLPSRLKFILNFERLYQFQIAYHQYDTFIKMLLRLSGAIFDQYVNIDEKEIARRLNLSFQQVVALFQVLEKHQVLHYLPQTDKPYLTFLQERMDAKLIEIDAKYIQDRRKNIQKKIDAVIAYIDQHECRSKMLLAYFDEHISHDCGVCDVCIAKNQAKNRSQRMKTITTQVLQLLAKSPLALHSLVEEVSLGTDDERLDAIRLLVDAQMIIQIDGLYRLMN